MANDEEQPQRQPNGRFVKGLRRIAARVKGTPNKISRSLREGILDAACAHGSDGNGKNGLAGCMDWLLRYHTKAFVPLLVRLLPLQVNGAVNHTTKLQVNIVSIPRGHYYTKDGVLHPPTDRCIEHNVDAHATFAHDEVATIDAAPGIDDPSPTAAPQPSTNDAAAPMMALVIDNDDAAD